MKQKRDFSVRGPVTDTGKKYKVKRRNFYLLPFAFCLVLLAGCGRQMARIDESQAQLQMMVKANSLQIADIAGSLEESQQELRAAIGSIQGDVTQVAADVSAVVEAQMKLHATMQEGNLQVSDKIAEIGQDQEALSVNLGRAIAGVQGETRQVAADVSAVAADVTAVTAEQAKMYETVQENNLQLTNKVAVIEQAQQKRQNTIGGMEANINALAAGIGALGEDVLRLQEILQSNIRELVSIADISGQKQNEFRESMKKNLQTLDESLTTLKASQNKLQSRIEQMQNEAPDLGNMPAAIDQLREQLEELSRTRTSADDFDSFEYETSADTAAEANSLE